MDETLNYELEGEAQMSKNSEGYIADYPSQVNYWSPHSYSWSKKAIDLSIHSRNECQKTIFEDAEYFAENYSYKLMPITFEAVNETIIHIEHNYCYPVPKADNENKDSRVAGNLLTEIGERNYKKRKSKILPEEDDFNSVSDSERLDKEKLILKDVPRDEYEEFVPNAQVDEENFNSVQPLDLSLPFLQEQKSDMLRENHSLGPKIKSEVRNSVDIQQLKIHESNKENVKNNAREIEVTISKPGQKEYYQPCDTFLNDVARISQDLIKNDCCEIEIIDRTHSQDFRSIKSRTYYIVSQSTWRAFKNSTERIILTNDLNIGQPIQNNEKLTKPTYLIFDKSSLTESLARICEKKGGSFEYTCLEELKEPVAKLQENKRESPGKDHDSASPRKANSEPENYSAFDENLVCNNGTFEDRSEEKEKAVPDRETLKIGNSIETSISEKPATSEHRSQTKSTRSNNLNEIKSHNLSDAGKSFAESEMKVSEKSELIEKVIRSADSTSTFETEAEVFGDNAKAVPESTVPDEELLLKPVSNCESQNFQAEKEKPQISSTITLNIKPVKNKPVKTKIVKNVSHKNPRPGQVTSSKNLNEKESETDGALRKREKKIDKAISLKNDENLTAAENYSREKLSKAKLTSTSCTKIKDASKGRQDVTYEYSLRKRKNSNQTEKDQPLKEAKRHGEEVKEANNVSEQNVTDKGNKNVTETPPGRKTRSSSGSTPAGEKTKNSVAKMDVEKLENEKEHYKSDNVRFNRKRESKSAALAKICGLGKKSEGSESKTPLTPRKRSETDVKPESRNLESGSGSCKKKKTCDTTTAAAAAATATAAMPPAQTPETKSASNMEMTFTGYTLRSGNKTKSDCSPTKVLREDASSAATPAKGSSGVKRELRSSGVGTVKKDAERNLRSRVNNAKAANSKKSNATGGSAKKCSSKKAKLKESLKLKKQKERKRR